MAFQDRPYYRDREPGSTGNPAMWLLVGSVPLFTLFGVRVRMHASMIVYIGMELLFSSAGIGAANVLTAMGILFISVLLHEFGHIFGARMMGGYGDDILMWPLGGLAQTAPPHRPWPSFVTTACGPLVNILICIATGTALVILSHSGGAIPWFPLTTGLKSFIPTTNLTYYLFWIFLVNYALAAFNLLLVFYPFDGGRMIQELLWFKVGYYRSMMFATMVGMIGAVVAAILGLVTLNFWLVLIAGFGFYTCRQQRQMLKAEGPDGFEDEGLYSAAYETSDRPGWWARRRAARAAAAERAEQQQLDRILAKISAHGLQSLSGSEKRALRRATEHQRQRDAGGIRRG